MIRILATTVLLATATCASAQWLHYPTPGIPRTADGKPDMKASVPRTADGKPDLSGLWMLNAGPGNLANVTAELKPGEVQPWADAALQKAFGKYRH